MRKIIIGIILVFIFIGTNLGSKAKTFGQQSFVSEGADLVSSGEVSSKGLRILSWNIQNLGKSKMANDSVMVFISGVMSSYDIVAVQEVSTSEYGLRVIMKLDSLLEIGGGSWDYVVSEATSGDGSECYAYLFRSDRVKLLEHMLDKDLSDRMDREPYIMKVRYSRRHYVLANVHLVPRSKNPSLEVKELVSLGKRYKSKRFILMGDFNLSESDGSFDGIKEWFGVGLVGEKTSLKRKEGSEKLYAEYDNFFISKKIEVDTIGVVHFYKNFGSLREARKVSDHCPIFINIKR